MSKKFLSIFIGLASMFSMTACIGEDYDIGVPSAYIEVTIASSYLQYPLTKANIIWSSSIGDENQTVEDMKEFGLKQDKIWVYGNQEARFDVVENEENGGDSWPESISAKLWRNGESTDIEVNENGEFKIPDIEGNYVLEVLTRNAANRAQYVGNVVIEAADKNHSDNNKVND